MHYLYHIQVIFDPMTNLHLTTSFIKFKYQDSNEEAWLSVIDGKLIPNGPNIASGIVGTVWYLISGEHANDTVGKEVLSPMDETMFGKKNKFYKGNVVQINGKMYNSLFGEDADDKPYEYSITQIMDEDNVWGQAIRPTKKGKMKATLMEKRTYVTGIHLSEENKWKAKSIYNQLMEKQAKKLYKKSYKIIEKLYPDQQQQQNIYAQFSPNLKHGIIGNGTNSPNLFMMQNYLVAPFRIYYVYLPTKDVTITSLSDLPELINDKDKIDALIKDKMKDFDKKFTKTFNVKTRPRPPEGTDMDSLPDIDEETGRKLITPGEMQLARYALSNLVGGVGYWYGNQVWQMRPDQPPQYTADGTLLSAVPSRSFFPRGFLWDEGFHQLMIGMWNLDLSMEIIQSWLNSMNDMGWIPREQILGDEARSRVPQEFQIQRPHIANPPTMFLAINALVERYYASSDEVLAGIVCEDDDEVLSAEVGTDGESVVNDACKIRISETRQSIKKFVGRNWDLLVLNFEWYRITQKSPNDPELSFRWAGRTQHHNLPSGLDDYPRYKNVTKNEGHVDIHCWMIRLNQIMSKLASYLDKTDDANKWKQKADDLVVSLDNYHWNEEKEAYQDYAMVNEELEGENWSNASGPIKKVFVEHIGYVSSFPLFLEVLDPESPNLLAILKQISNEDGMWSKYGLRSLAKDDEFYGTDEDYWRGAIWMNMNYLGVKALYDYKEMYKSIENPNVEVKELLESLYKKLRKNLINNLYKEYAKFGFLYENYNGENGNGQRSKPFTGWSALIVNIISEIYP